MSHSPTGSPFDPAQRRVRGAAFALRARQAMRWANRRRHQLVLPALVIAGGALLAGFGAPDLPPRAVAAQNFPETAQTRDPFLRGLREGYELMAARAMERARYGMAADFEAAARKAESSGGVPVFETQLIADPARRASAQEWAELISGEVGQRLVRNAPKLAARILVAYDCVLRADYSDGDMAIRDACEIELFETLSSAHGDQRPPMVPVAPAGPVADAGSSSRISAVEHHAFAEIPPTTPPSVAPTWTGGDPLGGWEETQSFAEIETGTIEPVALEQEAEAAATEKPATSETSAAPARTAKAKPTKLPGDAPVGVVYFGEASVDVGAFEAQFAINDALARAEKYTGGGKSVTILIAGHSDAVGGRRHNRVLSEQRAQAVKRRLEERMVDRFRDPVERALITIKVKGYGESRPAMRGSSAEAARKNRRVELYVIVE